MILLHPCIASVAIITNTIEINSSCSEFLLQIKMDAQLVLYIPLALAIYMITKYFFHKLHNHPPSPFLTLPIIGHLYLLKNPLYRSLSTVSDWYGPVVLLQFGSRRVLVVSSPSAAEDCLSKNDANFASRPDMLAGKYLGYNFTSMAWAPYEDHWKNLRKISFVQILSTQRLQLLYGIRADEVKTTMRMLSRGSDGRKLADMKTVFFELTMNVIMRMVAGKRYLGEKVEDAAEAQRFKEIVKDTFRYGAPFMEDFLPVMRWLGVGGVEKIMDDVQRKADVFMQELVEECKDKLAAAAGGGEETGKTKTMIEMMLELQEKEPEYYTDAIIRRLMLVLLVGGSDTSAGTMEWALSLLVNHPEVLKKAQSEIDHLIGHNRLFEEADIAELPYLRCIINETLRMYPAGPLLVPHQSSRECSVGGYHIPANTMLMVNLWAIQNDSKIVKDATKFKPERFEGMDGHRNGFGFMPFGSGRRSCPGEGLAVRMVGLGLGSLIQCFDWERPGKELVDMSEGEGLLLPKATPLRVYCKPRSQVAHLLVSNT